jgi:hypothetical protein
MNIAQKMSIALAIVGFISWYIGYKIRRKEK